MNGNPFSPLYDLIGFSTAHPAGFANKGTEKNSSPKKTKFL
jgi:hypothetical protein